MNGTFVKAACAAVLAASISAASAADSPQKKMNILCVGAHPDDAELNCGGTLLRYHKMGHKIFIVLTTSGNTGSNEMRDIKEIERVREAEMLASAKTYDAQVRFLRADDERLLDSNEMRTKVLDALRWADPDVIFTHSPTDESPDHRMTSKLVRSMILSLPGINQQSSEKPCTKKVSVFTWGNAKCINFVPEVYVDISDELEAVCAAANLHESQKAWLKLFTGPKDLSISKRATAAHLGLQCGWKAAEAFKAFRIHGYMPNFRLLPGVNMPNRPLRVAAVGAHPDDIEQHVGGTLLKYKAMGAKVFFVLTTSGNTGSSSKMDPAEIGRIREAEQLESAKAYGAEVRFLRADDERLLDTNEMRTKVLDALRWSDPDVIFTHSPTDESPDHYMTSKLVRSMILSLPGINQQSNEKPCAKKVSVFTWENDACVGSPQPEVYVDISDFMEQKLATFRLHRSQVSYMNTFDIQIDDDVTVPDRFRGLQVGCKYAECFNAFRIHGYMPNFGLLP